MTKPITRNKEEIPYPTVILPESGSVVRTVPVWHVPKDIWPEGKIVYDQKCSILFNCTNFSFFFKFENY